MDLKDTVKLMQSDDYRERFMAEYYQLFIRCGKLKEMLKKWYDEELSFVPACNNRLLEFQLRAMEDYLTALESRAQIENIELW